MVFYKKFSFLVVLRLLFILVNMLLLAYIFGDSRLFFNHIILFILLVLQVGELIRYIKRTNKELTKFLLAVKHSDFSINFNNAKIGKSFSDLNEAFTEIISTYKSATIEKEAQFHYLRMVVSNINIGIISLENSRYISLMNKPAERLLNVKGIHNWDILREKKPLFVKAIEQLRGDGRQLIELRSGSDTNTLSVDVNSMIMLDKDYKLITFQDIHNEIEQKEIEAWHKLIRILTHEIMNSATPISSLTETMQSMLGPNGVQISAAELNNNIIEDLRFSLQTIQKRSDGMLAFIDDYRKLTKIAKPNPEACHIEHLFKQIYYLEKAEIEKIGIQFEWHVHPEANVIRLDSQLIEQVLINLIKNSLQAVEDQSTPRIEMKAYREKSGYIIEVSDNGSGISLKEMEEIFVPFFTTKKEGSGIGLSLSKQIMHLHGGTIKVKSEPNMNTSFYLYFKG